MSSRDFYRAIKPILDELGAGFKLVLLSIFIIAGMLFIAWMVFWAWVVFLT